MASQVLYGLAFVQPDLRQVKCYMVFVENDLWKNNSYITVLNFGLRQVERYMAFVESDFGQQ